MPHMGTDIGSRWSRTHNIQLDTFLGHNCYAQKSYNCCSLRHTVRKSLSQSLEYILENMYHTVLVRTLSNFGKMEHMGGIVPMK